MLRRYYKKIGFYKLSWYNINWPHVSSASLLSEQIEKLRAVCGLYIERWSYAIHIINSGYRKPNYFSNNSYIQTSCELFYHVFDLGTPTIKYFEGKKLLKWIFVLESASFNDVHQDILRENWNKLEKPRNRMKSNCHFVTVCNIGYTLSI